jgi:hypothetical protein
MATEISSVEIPATPRSTPKVVSLYHRAVASLEAEQMALATVRAQVGEGTDG